MILNLTSPLVKYKPYVRNICLTIFFFIPFMKTYIHSRLNCRRSPRYIQQTNKTCDRLSPIKRFEVCSFHVYSFFYLFQMLFFFCVWICGFCWNGFLHITVFFCNGRNLSINFVFVLFGCSWHVAFSINFIILSQIGAHSKNHSKWHTQ